MTPVCDWCGGWIEAPNAPFPGYCSPGCRDDARLDEETHRARRRRARVSKTDFGGRTHAAANRRVDQLDAQLRQRQ